jgi:hypothetical protein
MDSVIGTTVVFLLLTSIGASSAVGIVRQRPTREGRKDYTLHDLGTEQPNRARRTTVSAETNNLHIDIHPAGDGRNASRNASLMHFVNAYTNELNVTVELKDVTYSLSYGDTLVANLGRKLDLNEIYTASVGDGESEAVTLV